MFDYPFEFKVWDKNNRVMLNVEEIDFRIKMLKTEKHTEIMFSEFRPFDEFELLPYIGIKDLNDEKMFKLDIVHVDGGEFCVDCECDGCSECDKFLENGAYVIDWYPNGMWWLRRVDNGEWVETLFSPFDCSELTFKRVGNLFEDLKTQEEFNESQKN